MPAPSPTPAPQEAPAPAPEPEPEPPLESGGEPALTPDTTPPPEITGLIAADAYDEKVNLWWDKCDAADFAGYNVYVNREEISDIGGMEPDYQTTDINACNCQVTFLENDTPYYFAVTASDKNGNEITQVSAVSATPTTMPRGTADPKLSVDIYRSDKAWAGTTLLPDNHNREMPRVIEVNMLGEIIWQYVLPEHLKQYTNPGFDVELLANNNILLVLPGNGVYEIDHNGNTIWSYLDNKVSHDADRLPGGNTLVVYGNEDGISDAQVKEINPEGEIVWSWYARDQFNESPYKDIYDQGWTHTNAVTRLPNGNTLISPRNFGLLVEVDPQGEVISTCGEGFLVHQHDPEMLLTGNILIANHDTPHSIIEIDPNTEEIVWEFVIRERENWPVRDANRLPNGNTLITGTTKILEVTPEGEIVWQYTLDATFQGIESAARGFYKAERIDAEE